MCLFDSDRVFELSTQVSGMVWGSIVFPPTSRPRTDVESLTPRTRGREYRRWAGVKGVDILLLNPSTLFGSSATRKCNFRPRPWGLSRRDRPGVIGTDSSPRRPVEDQVSGSRHPPGEGTLARGPVLPAGRGAGGAAEDPLPGPSGSERGPFPPCGVRLRRPRGGRKGLLAHVALVCSRSTFLLAGPRRIEATWG